MELRWAPPDARPLALLVHGVAAGTSVTVLPTSVLEELGRSAIRWTTPGRCTSVADGIAFVPRFAFMPGQRYTVFVEGEPVGTIDSPRSVREPTTEVVAVHPGGATIPRNALRLYITFSAPMS